MEQLFNKALIVSVLSRDSEERKSTLCVTIDLQLCPSTVHKRNLHVRLTDDKDPYFLFTLSISEEDFQSLKVQQGLLIDFGSFPQKFIELLELCHSEQEADSPRFLLQLCTQGPAPEGPSSLSVVETNAFKHLTHLSLRLNRGSDREVKEYLASCLNRIKEEKEVLERRLKRTEEDLSRQLSCTQQTLCEKSKELEKLRSEWTNQSSSLSSRYSEELQSEREKSLELQRRLTEQAESSSQQLRSRLTEVEASCRELTERRYKNESAIRDLRMKLVAADEESQRSKQQVLSLRRDNSQLDSQLHEKERALSQLQTRAAVLEQEIKDKELLMSRTKDVLEATQQQKVSIEENVEGKDVQIKKLESTVKSLSEDVLKANSIIQKLLTQGKTLVGKNNMKNRVIVSQEKVVQETTERLQTLEKEFQSSQLQLSTNQQQMSALKEQLESTMQKLNESREVLKTNENLISWLNKQLNERQMNRATPPEPAPPPPAATVGSKSPQFPVGRTAVPPVGGALSSAAELRTNTQLDAVGLDAKYFERMDSIPVYGLTSHLFKELPQPKASLPSAYFSA